jgi:ABC-type multidrug transport system fused ATPase/permease subunit
VDEFTCQVEPNSMVAIVGRSGSGKTTIQQLARKSYSGFGKFFLKILSIKFFSYFINLANLKPNKNGICSQAYISGLA